MRKFMELAKGVHYYFTPSNKYKTNQIKFRFSSKLDQKRIPNRVLVASMLSLANQAYPTSQAFREHLANLYGAEFTTHISRRGKVHYLDINISFVRDAFLSKKNVLVEEILTLLRISLISPLAEDGHFDEQSFQIEKKNILFDLKDQEEDSYYLAHQKLNRLFYEDESLSIPRLGTDSLIETVNATSAYEELQRMLVEDQIDVFFIGDFQTMQVEEHLAKFKFKDRDCPLEFEYQQEFTNVVRDHFEKKDVNQSILELGYHVPVRYGSKEHLALIVLNGLLGAYANSKLFVNVREKEGLAYTVSSTIDVYTGYLRMYAGIDKGNRMRAFTLMNRQLTDLKKGKFSEKELFDVKQMVKNSKLLSLDQQESLIEASYLQTVFKSRYVNEGEWFENLENLTKGDVVNLAKEVRLQALFFLEGNQ